MISLTRTAENGLICSEKHNIFLIGLAEGGCASVQDSAPVLDFPLFRVPLLMRDFPHSRIPLIGGIPRSGTKERNHGVEPACQLQISRTRSGLCRRVKKESPDPGNLPPLRTMAIILKI